MITLFQGTDFLVCTPLVVYAFCPGISSVWRPGTVFTKGLSQVLGLSWLYFYTKVKPKTWLRPFVNTAPGPGFTKGLKFRHFFCLDKS